MVLWLNVWNKELLTLRNFFVVTKKFLKAKFDCNSALSRTIFKNFLTTFNNFQQFFQHTIFFFKIVNSNLQIKTTLCLKKFLPTYNSNDEEKSQYKNGNKYPIKSVNICWDCGVIRKIFYNDYFHFRGWLNNRIWGTSVAWGCFI